MRLSPVPIPSDASKAPILPGFSWEWGDLMAFVVLLLPVFLVMSHRTHGKVNFTLVLIVAIPGLLASIPLVLLPAKDSQRGWQRMLAFLQYRFISRRQWLTSAIYAEDNISDMEVMSCGKEHKIDFNG